MYTMPIEFHLWRVIKLWKMKYMAVPQQNYQLFHLSLFPVTFESLEGQLPLTTEMQIR